jgi:hypothetical protein
VLQELREMVSDPEGYARTLREATNAFNRGEFAGAADLFAAALERFPSYADLHARHGLARMENSDPQLFKYMFDTVTVLEAGADESQIEFDALIEPGIDAFEFSVPNQSNTDAFAVWIRYRVKVFNADGKLVGNFPFSAYGKSLTTTMGGSDALQRAAVLAMRDAAALMIIRFNPKEFMRSLEGDGTSPAEEEETASAAVQTEAREGATE